MKATRVFLTASLFTFLSLMLLNYRNISRYSEWQQRHRSYGKTKAQNWRKNVCPDIFEIGKQSANMSKMMELGTKVVAKHKKEKQFLFNYFYDILGYAQPHMATPSDPGKGISGSNYTVKKQWRFEQADGKFPHLACRLRNYKGRDVAQCAKNRSKRGKSTHIMYIGDSRIRQHIEVLLDHIRDIDLVITTYKGEVITVEDFLGQKGSKEWFKYKHDFRVESPASPGLIIDFHWAAIIESDDTGPKGSTGDKNSEYQVGAMNLLKKLDSDAQATLPDIVLLNTGAWQLIPIRGNIIDQVEHTAVTVMQMIYPLLSRLSQRTTVVWALPDSFKEFMLHDFSSKGKYTQQTNAILEWVLNGQAQLVPPAVMVWDSFLPISYAALSDCITFLSHNVDLKQLPPYSIYKPEISWHCTERMHVGFEALLIAAQMTVNHVCNPFMEEGEYCCSK